MTSTVYLVRNDQITRVSPEHAARHAPHLPTFATLDEAKAHRLQHAIRTRGARGRARSLRSCGLGAVL